MQLMVLTGNIMKCNQCDICNRREVYRRIPTEKEWQIIPDELVKKTVLIRVSETEYVDADKIISVIGLLTRMALGKTISCYPKKYEDFYVDVDSLKPYYKQPKIDINIAKIKRDMRIAKKMLNKETEKTIGQFRKN